VFSFDAKVTDDHFLLAPRGTHSKEHNEYVVLCRVSCAHVFASGPEVRADGGPAAVPGRPAALPSHAQCVPTHH